MNILKLFPKLFIGLLFLGSELTLTSCVLLTFPLAVTYENRQDSSN